jgi:cardiolipin synthase A/B
MPSALAVRPLPAAGVPAFTALLLAVACGGAIDPGPAAARSSPVRVIVEPEAGPDTLLALLASARRSLWMEMYLLTDTASVDTLVARRRAGVDVRVILEPHPYQADGANQTAFTRLAAAGVLVAWASPGFALTHAKFAVIDHVRLLVLTLNLTRSGLSANREYAVVDDELRDVVAAEALIAADLTGGALGSAPAGRVLASPTGTRPALAAALDGATRSIAVEMEELSDVAMTNELITARTRGVAVTVALPGAGRSPATESALHRLADAGVVVRLLDAPAPTLHAKAVVADDWLYVGSANLTAASLDANREVGLGLTDPGAIRTVARTIAADLARGRSP